MYASNTYKGNVRRVAVSLPIGAMPSWHGELQRLQERSQRDTCRDWVLTQDVIYTRGEEEVSGKIVYSKQVASDTLTVEVAVVEAWASFKLLFSVVRLSPIQVRTKERYMSVRSDLSVQRVRRAFPTCGYLSY